MSSSSSSSFPSPLGLLISNTFYFLSFVWLAKPYRLLGGHEYITFVFTRDSAQVVVEFRREPASKFESAQSLPIVNFFQEEPEIVVLDQKEAKNEPRRIRCVFRPKKTSFFYHFKSN